MALIVSPKKSAAGKFLIVVKVCGRSWPVRFIVSGDDTVKRVIEKTLKQYARLGHLPILGSDSDCFTLYPSDGTDSEGFNPTEKIGACGVRICSLRRNPTPAAKVMHARKENQSRSWVHKSLSFRRIMCH
ncbi:hypothetical protein M569_16383 [Genlisea aurea]|uniref:DUF7054 domain-containing protein n=1 Tax=Genlisea aurea TaxID=192259 RepID=S8D713_9LAMI|nr:hypothetical protein M569_16383 [Genlisea aurea]